MGFFFIAFLGLVGPGCSPGRGEMPPVSIQRNCCCSVLQRLLLPQALEALGQRWGSIPPSEGDKQELSIPV